MICPYCHKEIPEAEKERCPYCKAAIPAEEKSEKKEKKLNA